MKALKLRDKNRKLYVSVINTLLIFCFILFLLDQQILKLFKRYVILIKKKRNNYIFCEAMKSDKRDIKTTFLLTSF